MSAFESAWQAVRRAAGRWQLSALDPLIAACEQRLTAWTRLDVAVFGRFKAGKSSFLNHLIGRDVLPVGVVPLTAVVTRLRYGAIERATVGFLDQSKKDIPLEEIGRYVGESENPNNEKRVAAVELELPELKRWAPLEFVDTPGLDSVLKHNTEVTLDWLPYVGIALVAISADAPLSDRDLNLLAELRRHTPQVVLLLTKADLLSPAQRAEVQAFVSAQLRRHWPDRWPVFFYSIRPEEKALKQKFEQELLSPLIQQRASAAGAVTRHKLRTLLQRTIDYLQVALAATTQAESARAALRERLAAERQVLGDFREELAWLSHRWSAGALQSYRIALAPDQRALQTRVVEELRNQFSTWRLPLPAFIEAYRNWLHAYLHRELSALSESRRGLFLEPLEKFRQHLERELRAFQDRLAEHVRASLGLELEPPVFPLEVSAPPAPPVQVNASLMVPMDLLGYLVPMPLVRPWIERRFLRRARWEVEKNLSRLCADWQNRISAAIRKLTQEAVRQAESELHTLERLAAPKASDPSATLQADLVELKTLLAQMGSPRPIPA